jgi:endogenous inhibitor of DNA gyrase (YacG/DUF329 family)
MKTKEDRCLTCQQPLNPQAIETKSRFCSPRCQWIDLGAWIDGRHAIPGEPVDPLYPDQNYETLL